MIKTQDIFKFRRIEELCIVANKITEMQTKRLVVGTHAHNYKLSFYVFRLTLLLLSIVQVNLSTHPIILFERFIKGGGWFEIVVIAFYGAFVAYKMQNPLNVPKWRRITWTIFSFVFFSQLMVGLLGVDKFLMSGKL